MEPGSHAKLMELVLDHDKRLDALENEGHKVRDRIDQLEGDRTLVRELAESTRALAGHAKELAEGIEAIAERAVEKVLERRREAARASWKYRSGYVIAVISAAGFLVDHLHVHF